MSKEATNLLGSSKNVIDKDKNSKNVPKLEIFDVILMHFNVANNNYQQASKVFEHSYLINNLDN